MNDVLQAASHEAAAQAVPAAAAASGSTGASAVLREAQEVGLRALLVQGRDVEALAWAQQVIGA